MRAPITQKLDEIARRVKRLLAIRAVSWWIATTLLVAFLLSGVDFAMKFEHRIARVILSGFFLLFVIGSAMRWWRAVKRLPMGPLQIARWVERSVPQLRSQLSTAVDLEFENERRSLASSHAALTAKGSKRFEREADDASFSVAPKRRRNLSSDLAKRTTEDLQGLTNRLDLGAVVRPNMIYPSLIAFVVALLVLICVSVLLPRHCYAAAFRLVAPQSSVHWPTKNRLKIKSLADQCAMHSDLRIVVVDESNQLPRQVRLQVKDLGSETGAIRTREMLRMGDQMIVDFTDVRESMQVRAIGGDDKYMDWKTIEVVRPPKVQDLKLIAIPPSYVTDSPIELSETAQLLIDSMVLVSGETTEPLAAAKLIVKSDSGEKQIELSLAADGRRFFTPFVKAYRVTEQVTLTLQVTTQTKKADFPVVQMHVDAIEDDPPIVLLRKNLAENFAVPNGQVVTHVEVSDDVGIATIDLVISGLTVVRLFDESEIEFATHQRTSTIEHALDLEQFPELGPGQTVELWIQAQDGKGQLTRSNREIISLLSYSDFRRRIRIGEQNLLARLSQISESQDLAIQSTQKLIDRFTRQANADMKLHDSYFVEQLASVLEQQQNIETSLISDERSILKAFEELSSRLADNRIPMNNFSRRLYTTQQELNSLRKVFTEIIDVTIPKQVRSLQLAGVKEARRFEGAMTVLKDQQGEILDVVANVLAQMDLWNVLQQVNQRLTQLRNEQARLKAEVETASQLQFTTESEFPLRTGFGENDTSRTSTRSSLEWLADQRRIARQFERFQADMSNWRVPSSDDPKLQLKIGRVHGRLAEFQVGALIHQAIDDLRANRLLQASQTQARIVAALSKAIDAPVEFRQTVDGRTLDAELNSGSVNSPDNSDEPVSTAKGNPVSIDEIKTIRKLQKKVRDTTMAILKRVPPPTEHALDIENEMVAEIAAQAQQQRTLATRFERLIESLRSKHEAAKGGGELMPNLDSLDTVLFGGLEAPTLVPRPIDRRRPTNSNDDKIASDSSAADFGAVTFGKLKRAAVRLEDGIVDVGLVQLQNEILDELDLMLSTGSQMAGDDRAGPPARPAKNLAGGDGSQSEVNANEDNVGSENIVSGDPLAAEPVPDAETVRRDLLHRAWGKLPTRVRKFMPTGGREDFASGYENMIEDYYRRLAEDE